jgi:hypothetical protein
LDEALANRLKDLEQEEARLSAALEEAASRLAGKEELQGRITSLERGGGGAPGSGGSSNNAGILSSTEIFEQSQRTIVQGGSLRTWWFSNPSIRFVQLLLKTQGRPLDADVNLWQGPDNTPHKMKVYVEDGGMRTFHTLIATPIGPNTVAVRNTGMLEFPLDAVIEADRGIGATVIREASDNPELIQGGALRTWPFDTNVESVTVLVTTDGRPLNARIELLQGPNNNKQVVEVYTEDGMIRPFFAILETPGSGNVVRIVNTAPVEFPMIASVKPYLIRDPFSWTTDGIQIDKGW